MDTALVLPVSEIEPIVSHLRAAHDSSAAAGMPAHVTVLYPFRPYEDIDADCVAELAEIMLDVDAFDIRFGEWSRFPRVLWLAPEPAEPIVRLTEVLVSRFPDYPPYSGAFDTIIPHLTVAEGDEDVLAPVAEEMSRALHDPVAATIRNCALYAYDTGQWREKHSFPCGGRNHEVVPRN